MISHISAYQLMYINNGVSTSHQLHAIHPNNLAIINTAPMNASNLPNFVPLLNLIYLIITPDVFYLSAFGYYHNWH